MNKDTKTNKLIKYYKNYIRLYYMKSNKIFAYFLSINLIEIKKQKIKILRLMY